jgi:hypothetical protein
LGDERILVTLFSCELAASRAMVGKVRANSDRNEMSSRCSLKPLNLCGRVLGCPVQTRTTPIAAVHGQTTVARPCRPLAHNAGGRDGARCIGLTENHSSTILRFQYERHTTAAVSSMARELKQGRKLRPRNEDFRI